METEIIKTDNPNVVIVRTISETPIDLSQLENDIKDIKDKICIISDAILEIPENLDPRIVEALQERNAFHFGEKLYMEQQLIEKLNLLNTLTPYGN